MGRAVDILLIIVACSFHASHEQQPARGMSKWFIGIGTWKIHGVRSTLHPSQVTSGDAPGDTGSTGELVRDHCSILESALGPAQRTCSVTKPTEVSRNDIIM